MFSATQHRNFIQSAPPQRSEQGKIRYGAEYLTIEYILIFLLSFESAVLAKLIFQWASKYQAYPKYPFSR